MLSVKERDKLKVSLYPNHANNKITIEAENILRISLLNINGQQFFDQNLASVSMYTIDLYNYNPGIYIAKIYTEEGMVNRKFIISR
jgi:heptaprenylglyceryl phosphate synthase